MVSTFGLLMPGAASALGVELTHIANAFTAFTVAVLVGYGASFYIFDLISIRSAILSMYVLCAGSLALFVFSGSLVTLTILFGIFGFCVSVAVCGANSLITRLWQGQAQQTVIVTQDAMFNGGGYLFAALATSLVSANMHFGSTWLITAAMVVPMIILSLFTDYEKDQIEPEPGEDRSKTLWPAGFVMMGISLLLFMLAKITILVWGPQHLIETFQASTEAAGEFMSNLFLAAFLGSLAGIYLVSRMNVKYLVYFFVTLSLVSIFLLANAASFESAYWLSYAYGLSVSATFNGYVAFSLTLLPYSTHRNIAYMLIMSSIGSSIAPPVSTWAVSYTNEISSALTFALVCLMGVVLSLVIGHVMSRTPTPSPSYSE